MQATETRTKLQVRRTAKSLTEMSPHFKAWNVVGRVNGFPCHVPCATQIEARYRRARKLAGLDFFAKDEQRIGSTFIDEDGVWKL